MSNITGYSNYSIAASQSVSNCSTQTHLKEDKWTHADLSLVRDLIESVRPYSKKKAGPGYYKFIELKEKYPDLEITKILADFDSLLMDLTWDINEVPKVRITRNSRKTKRGESFDCRLESIWESPIQQDVGTDPMPATDVSDKATQVDINELYRKSSPLHDDYDSTDETTGCQAPTRKPPTGRNCRRITGNIQVFVERSVFNRFNSITRNPWEFIGLGSTSFRRRPVLAPIESAHSDALQRLETLESFTSNIFNERNRRNGDGAVVTVNEIPVTEVLGRSNTRRYRRRMIQFHTILNVDGEILPQSEINEYVAANAHYTVPTNPFRYIRPSQRRAAESRAAESRAAESRAAESMTEITTRPVSARAAYLAAPFWQRLGIRVPVPRVWLRATGATVGSNSRRVGA